MEQTRQIVPNLTNKELKRLDDLFQMFCKTEANKLKFHEFLIFCIDRQIVSPRISFSVLFDLFLDCIDEEENIPQQQEKEKYLNKDQFNSLLVQLSRIIFVGEEKINNLDRLFNEIILAEKSIANKDGIETTRVPIFDESTKKILTEQVFSLLCQYEDELKSCFIAYLSQNYENDEIILTWKEIALQKRKITSHGFVRFMKDSQVIPNIFSIENIEDYMIKMIPAVVIKEQEFYSKKKLVYIYEKELDNKDQHYDGDPCMHFYEFQLLLCRIGFEIGKRKGEEKSEPDIVINNFFQNIIGIRKNNQIESKPFPNINKKLFTRLNNYYAEIQKSYQIQAAGSEGEQEDEDLRNPQELLAELQNKQIFEADPIQFDAQDIYNVLNKELPPVPEEPVQVQENPPPYKFGEKPKKKKAVAPQIKVVIGDQIPAEVKEKGSKNVKIKPPKKKQLKAGEKPPKPIIFAGYPPPDSKMGYDYLENLNNELTYGEKLLGTVNRGTMSEIDVLPLLLQEILYPPKTPASLRHLIESAINSYNQSNYIVAIKNFQEARNIWQKSEENMTDQIQLFFEYSKASIYMSAGRDDYALYYYMQAKNFSDRLPYINPDRSLAYCGLGHVLFNTEEYVMSLRAYLKAREIRESLYGSEHIDTATIYNNLGCCMYMLERNSEALAYFNISHAILQLELGALNNRTMVPAQNIKKTEKGYFKNIPSFKTLWETYEDDPYKKVKKSKKKKKK